MIALSRHLARLLAPALLFCIAMGAQAAAWTSLDPLGTARRLHTMTPLANGRLLVAGGFNAAGAPVASAELFDPASGRWTLANAMSVPRAQHTATLLPDGRVLVAAGRSTTTDMVGLPSAEIYDPATGNWTPVATPMPQGKFGHDAIRLASGLVLACGGNGDAACFTFNAKTGVWTTTGSMNQTRFGYTMTEMHDGRVLATGGGGLGGSWMASSEVYSPTTGTWQPLLSMNVGRYRHAATLLSNGKVLVTGGEIGVNSAATATAELFDPISGSWTLIPTNMSSSRMNHSSSRLPSGRVLIIGGESGNPLTDGMDSPVF